MSNEEQPTIAIRLDDDLVSINGKVFRESPAFDDLYQLLGRETDKIESPQGENYWFWCKTGVYAFGRGYSHVVTIGIVIDDNGQVPNTRHRYWGSGLRAFHGDLIVCGLRRYDTDSAEGYAERLKTQKAGEPFQQGNSWSASVATQPRTKLTLHAGLDSTNSLYYAEVHFRFPSGKVEPPPSNLPETQSVTHGGNSAEAATPSDTITSSSHSPDFRASYGPIRWGIGTEIGKMLVRGAVRLLPFVAIVIFRLYSR